MYSCTQRRSVGWEYDPHRCIRKAREVEWAGYYAGFCPGFRRGRPSISGLRCRSPLAVYPETRRAALAFPVRPCSGRGLPSRPGHPGRWWSLTPPFHPYRRREAGGGLLSVALSRGLPRVGVTHRPALWSPDVPRHPRPEGPGMTRPSCRPIPSSSLPAPTAPWVPEPRGLRSRIPPCAPGWRRNPGRTRSRRPAWPEPLRGRCR